MPQDDEVVQDALRTAKETIAQKWAEADRA